MPKLLKFMVFSLIFILTFAITCGWIVGWIIAFSSAVGADLAFIIFLFVIVHCILLAAVIVAAHELSAKQGEK